MQQPAVSSIDPAETRRGVRPALESILLSCLRAYTYNTPIAKGKYRLAETAVKSCRYLPTRSLVPTLDGRTLFADLTSGTQTSVYFHGTYERVLTEMVSLLIREGDTCVDVGANFGWYTTLFRKLCGASGSVHAFEPVPPIFDGLVDNWELMGSPQNVYLNNFALGEAAGEIEVNTFSGLSTGHASISDRGRDDATAHKCRIETFDTYAGPHLERDVDLVKVDVEGAEMLFLNGAGSLFLQKRPPMILMEMALEQTRNFGYLPDELIRFIRNRAGYEFYAVNEYNGTLERVDGFRPEQIGANVFCIPAGEYEDRTGELFRFLK